MGGGGDTMDDSVEIPFQSFRRKPIASSSGMGMDGHSLTLAVQNFPLATTASPTFQGAPKDDFREAVVVHDMPEPRQLPSLDSCQERFPWAHKEAGLAPHSVVGIVLQVVETLGNGCQ